MNKNYEVLDNIFKGDISEWMMYQLPKYLDRCYDKWVLNPINENTVEIFISQELEWEVWEEEEQMFEETLYIALNLLEAYGVEDKDGYLTELIPGYALEHFSVHPLSSLGDEPLEEDDRLLFSDNFLISDTIFE